MLHHAHFFCWVIVIANCVACDHPDFVGVMGRRSHGKAHSVLERRAACTSESWSSSSISTHQRAVGEKETKTLHPPTS